MTPRAEAATPTAAVVVVTYNSSADIRTCLTSLLETTRTESVAVVVVDNASTDDTVRIVRECAAADDRVHVLANDTNVGFGAACNQGADAVASEFVVLVNPDTVTHEGAVAALVEEARDHPQLGPIGGVTLDAAGDLDPRSVQRAPRLSSLLMWALAVPLWSGRSRLLSRWASHPDLYDVAALTSRRSVDVVIGCLLCLRREHWDLLGGFDERYFLYCEDVDLSMRATAAGLTPAFTPRARITHAWGVSSPTFGRKIVALMRGRVTLLTTHWHPVAARLGIGCLLVGVAVRAAGERLSRRPGGWSEALSAHAEWTSGWPQTVAAQRNGSAS